MKIKKIWKKHKKKEKDKMLLCGGKKEKNMIDEFNKF